MISIPAKKNIYIEIITYKRLDQDSDTRKQKMDNKINKKCSKNGKFVCAVCLNTKNDDKTNECCKNTLRACPICAKHCEHCTLVKKKADETELNAKNVRTSDTNVKQGLSLLNEVLTVFQNKKEDTKAKSSKDVGVSTDKTLKTQHLTINTFQFSIDETKRPVNGKFSVVNSNQPSYLRKSQYCIDLIKNKSSSIPQMKLEELKHSLKEKTKSKDAIEEVNRMFAIVKKSEKRENHNRPMIRNGPRVLPVVKNKLHGEPNEEMKLDIDKNSCKCCQTCMSSGDSFTKPECLQNMENERCEKCLYMLCCHYQNKHRNINKCDQCKNKTHEHHWHHEKHSVLDEN